MNRIIQSIANKNGLIAKYTKGYEDIISKDFIRPLIEIRTQYEEGPRGDYYEYIIYDSNGILVATGKEQGNYAGGLTSGFGQWPVDINLARKELISFHYELMKKKGQYVHGSKPLPVFPDWNISYSDDQSTFSIFFNIPNDEYGPKRGL